MENSISAEPVAENQPLMTLSQWIEISLGNAKIAQQKVESSLLRPKGPQLAYWEGYIGAIEDLQLYLESRQDNG